jgi:drug/metabolite transporter (DMT)-like permease
MQATLMLTVVAMMAFAGNSLLARDALAGGSIDAASFTAIRLVSGAVALVALLAWQRGTAAVRRAPGNWISALALLGYAMAFSFAYLRLSAATGALVLFSAVQASMICWSLARGDRPTPREMIGLGVAFAAFVYLLLPGLHTPDPLGSVLMMAAGVSWGVYSLRGRGKGPPLDETAGNFVRSGLVCVPLLLLAGGHAEARGIGLAVVSGVVTSGLGYAIWYRALPGLSTTQAATVQLTVPIIAAIGAVAFLSETLTIRLVVASACILGGVAFAILSRPAVKAA